MKSPESAAYRRGLGIFPTETPPTGAPKHLFSLPERIEGLGGSFELDSTPGCGSWLTVTIATAECPTRRASVTS